MEERDINTKIENVHLELNCFKKAIQTFKKRSFEALKLALTPPVKDYSVSLGISITQNIRKYTFQRRKTQQDFQ